MPDFDPRTHLPQDASASLQTMQVTVPIALLHRRPSRQSPLETQLLFGHTFKVYKRTRGWAWGQSLSPVKASDCPGYVGFIPLKALTEDIQNTTHRVACLKAPVFKSADIKSRIMDMLPLGAHIFGRDVGDFLETSNGFLHRLHVQKWGGRSEDTDFVSIAESHLGLPYIWGGISSDGLDCSGLVMTSLRHTGVDVPRDSDMQEKIGRHIEGGTPLMRGDLIFWKGHVGIMQDETRIIHANAYHMKVASEPLSVAVSRIGATGGPISARRRLA